VSKGSVDEGAAERHCSCLFDYVSARWTPATYATARERIDRELLRNGVVDDCLNLAGGWSNKRP
jgi:hypothetical protein